ncbi:MAG: hypothetical protein IPM56_11190 [Ignavibacteriales bacterium]|nr:MAG: hypothetical protein IPM56_11190 [Ignavibacteriales bacterium]
MKYCFIFLALVALNCTTSQNSGLYEKYNPDDFLYWSADKTLKWSDFHGSPSTSNQNLPSEIFIYNPSTIEKSNVLSKPAITSLIVMDKKKSWCRKEKMTEKYLLYNQVIFDLYELNRREFEIRFSQTDFSTEGYREEFKKLSDENNKTLLARIEQFRIESNLGDDIDVVKSWNTRIRLEILTLN